MQMYVLYYTFNVSYLNFLHLYTRVSICKKNYKEEAGKEPTIPHFLANCPFEVIVLI